MNTGDDQGVSDRLVAVANTLLTQSLTPFPDDVLVEQMRDIETAKRILAAAEHRYLVEASDRDLWQQIAGVKNLNQFLIETLRLSKADAAARVRAARELGTFHDLTGQDIEPRLPHTAAAQATGDASPDHARAIMNVMRRIPRGVSREECDRAEELLAQAAREVTPDDLKGIGEKILAYLDPDGRLSDDVDRLRMREFFLCKQRPDGMREIKGCVGPELGAALEMILAKWARPGMCNPEDPDSPTPADATDVLADELDTTESPTPANQVDDAEELTLANTLETTEGPRPASELDDTESPTPLDELDGERAATALAATAIGIGAGVGEHEGSVRESGFGQATRPCADAAAARAAVLRARHEAAAARDTRTAGQRNHDALLAFLLAGGGPESLGNHRGLPVSVVLTMSVKDLEQGTGIATTATGGTMSVPEAVRLAQKTGATPYLAVFDPAGMPLHLSAPRRLANHWQRLALTAAERGCTRPGCDAPATMCAVHHVIDWAKGGPTVIENLTLACDACHSLITGTDTGWETIKLGPRAKYPGHTGWKAPRHVDRQQSPRVNLRHHPDRLLAQVQAQSARAPGLQW